MRLAVASGKGGTGKTTVATNLALSLAGTGNHHVQLVDCDAEEPNAHIFIKPVLSRKTSVTLPVPKVDEGKCAYCGLCAEVCTFNAIMAAPERVLVFSELCHGCGACSLFCPSGAIEEEDFVIGTVEYDLEHNPRFFHGILDIGKPLSPPVISKVKELADYHYDQETISIWDAPPGTSCAAVEAVRGADFCVLVTEPTPFGMNDFELAYQMVSRLGVPAGVIINRSDIGDSRISEFCHRKSIPILAEIPEDKRLAEEYAAGNSVAKKDEHWRKLYLNLFAKIAEKVSKLTEGLV